MLIDALKLRIAQAVKDKDAAGRDVLRLAFGEIQTAEARAGKPPTDAEMIAIVRKLVKSNEETLTLGGEGPNAPTLRHEIAILSELLPRSDPAGNLVISMSENHAYRTSTLDGGRFRVLASDDECRVLVYLAERLAEGARHYGRMDLANDRRDFARERAEELADALVYTAMGEVQRVVIGAQRSEI